MRDHALIGKFLRFWPTKKALHGWIASKWKPKGQVTLQLGPKGFFIAIFNCLEDKTRIFEGGSYFFNSAGLYLREWKAGFNPDKEDFNWAPVWIRMYSLPSEYWNEETLKDISNSLGAFIKVVEETKSRRYTSYTRICVHMHLAKELTDAVSLFHDDFEWIQTTDYGHVPFRCRKCHEHGHLFRDCPLNLQSKVPATKASKDAEGFTRVSSRRKHAKKPPIAPEAPKKPETRNSFETLSSQTNLEDHAFIPPSDPSPSTQVPPPNPSASPSKSTLISTLVSNSTDKNQASDTALKSSTMEIDPSLALSIHQRSDEEEQNKPIHMEEEPESVYLGGLDILKLEAACRQKEFSDIPPREIERLEVVLTRAQQNKYLGIQAGSPWDGKKILKDSKKRERKTDL